MRALPHGQVPYVQRVQGIRGRGEVGPGALPVGRLRPVRLPAADRAGPPDLRGASGRRCRAGLRGAGQRGPLAADGRRRDDRRHGGRGRAGPPGTGGYGRGQGVRREAYRRGRPVARRAAPVDGPAAGGNSRHSGGPGRPQGRGSRADGRGDGQRGHRRDEHGGLSHHWRWTWWERPGHWCWGAARASVRARS